MSIVGRPMYHCDDCGDERQDEWKDLEEEGWTRGRMTPAHPAEENGPYSHLCMECTMIHYEGTNWGYRCCRLFMPSKKIRENYGLRPGEMR